MIDSSTYSVEAGIDTDGDGSSEGQGIVISGSLATADGLGLIVGNPVAGGRTGVEVVVSGDLSDNDPPVVTEFRDEAWGYFVSNDVNSAGQWIVSAVSNLDATRPDDTEINGNYLIRNGAIDREVVDPLDPDNVDRSLEAVTINEDGDFAFVYGEALYINNELVLDTKGNDAFQISVESSDGGAELVTLDRLLARGKSLALTDRNEADEVFAYVTGADDSFAPDSLGDGKYLIRVPYVIPEPASIALLLGAAPWLLRRRAGAHR